MKTLMANKRDPINVKSMHFTKTYIFFKLALNWLLKDQTSLNQSPIKVQKLMSISHSIRDIEAFFNLLKRTSSTINCLKR